MENITNYLIKSTVTTKNVVKAWEENIMLPTYAIGEEEKNPMFLEKRVYQGSSGVVYPYPVIEKVSDQKKDKSYKALFIENEYIKVMILPELGGRIQMAYDKIRQRHFVYYNQVIKPALVGLTGPWISGGIEFNWPQHHRPSTFLPVDYGMKKNEDGSITLWCNEVERMFRMKGMHGVTLYPGKAYIEVKVKLYNRTAFPQTFLWWANPAVAVNDTYKSVFPPDVHAVFDHGKRDVSDFPIATGIYYKQDYSAGVDISKYKNIPVPTSYMAVASAYDFVGGYDDDTNAGLLHVANHHISPGKKQWTWGNGDFGKAWDRNLTDEDGPYVELMTGVYTDNQPDFAWLQPYEEKSWEQYFMPYAEVGNVKNATKDAIVNIEIEKQEAKVTVYTTAEHDNLHVCLKNASGKIFLDAHTSISPLHTYISTVFVGQTHPEDLIFELYTPAGNLMLRYQADNAKKKPMPKPAKAARNPKEITSIEQLYLTGLHLEQYRHATYHAIDYYTEALNREPGDIRCNNATGLLLMRSGQFARAEHHFRKALTTQTARNPNPYDGEPRYNLGYCLLMQGRPDEAYEAFFKATWNAAWQDSSYYALAQIDASRGLWTDALDRINRSLIRNAHNHKARQLKASILRKLNKKEEALHLIDASLYIDPFNMGCYFEKYLLTNDSKDLRRLINIMRGAMHSFIEYALDFAAAGLYAEAGHFLTLSVDDEADVYPIIYYALGYFSSMQGNKEKAKEYYIRASKMSPDKCFPNRIEEIDILKDAMALNPSDAFAPYYLGNLWYAARQYDEAKACWETSAHLNPRFPTVLRNLALAYYNKFDRKEEAKDRMEKAFALDEKDARVFMELDQLYKKIGLSPSSRLALFEKYADLVEERDDLCIERITLHNLLGHYTTAKDRIASRRFHPWEGGEGRIISQYIICHVALAKEAIKAKKYAAALRWLHALDAYPVNLGEGKLANAEENDVDYYKGLAYRGVGDEQQAVVHFQKATVGATEPQQAFFYNDQQPDKIYYQGLAWAALGDEAKASGRFNKLIDYGKRHVFDDCRIDYFAVSLPDLAIWEEDLNLRNQVHCYYVMGLGYLGLGDKTQAKKYLDRVNQLDINHQGAHIHRKNL